MTTKFNERYLPKLSFLFQEIFSCYATKNSENLNNVLIDCVLSEKAENRIFIYFYSSSAHTMIIFLSLFSMHIYEFFQGATTIF